MKAKTYRHRKSRKGRKYRVKKYTRRMYKMRGG